jgi:hypothetical protein
LKTKLHDVYKREQRGEKCLSNSIMKSVETRKRVVRLVEEALGGSKEAMKVIYQNFTLDIRKGKASQEG